MRPRMFSHCLVKDTATTKRAPAAEARMAGVTNSELPHEYACPGSSFECSRTMLGTGQDQTFPKRTVVLELFAVKTGQFETEEGIAPEKSFRSSLRSTRLDRAEREVGIVPPILLCRTSKEVKEGVSEKKESGREPVIWL